MRYETLLQAIGLLLLIGGAVACSGPRKVATGTNVLGTGTLSVRGPEPVAALRPPFFGARQLLRKAVADGVFPGGVVIGGRRDSVMYADAAGTYSPDDSTPVDTATVYDLASVTKVVATTTAVMMLVADGKLGLDTLAVTYVPEFTTGQSRPITIRHLLTHTSGLPAYRRAYLETQHPRAALDSLLSTPLQYEPGDTTVYSDIGAIVLGLAVEHISGRPLDEFTRGRIFFPLGMHSTTFRPPTDWIHRIAHTERDSTTGELIRGVVHDENARHLGGVAGHAGLFSTGPDLARFAVWMLDAYHGRVPPANTMYVPPDLVREFTTRQAGPEESTRALGWDTPDPDSSTAGDLMSRSAFGHTGFTGTSIWIDPVEELFVIMLTNRVSPTRDNLDIKFVRGPMADSVYVGIKNGVTR